MPSIRFAQPVMKCWAMRSEFFNHRLSTLIASFREWVRQVCPNSSIGSDLALSFIEDRFGTTHHLTSLFRFGFAISSCDRFELQQRKVVADERVDHHCIYRLQSAKLSVHRLARLPKTAGAHPHIARRRAAGFE